MSTEAPPPPPHEHMNIETNDDDDDSEMDQSDMYESYDSTTDSVGHYVTADDSTDMDDTPVQNDALITFEDFRSKLAVCSVHPERPFAAATTIDYHVYVWNTQTGEILLKMPNISPPYMSFNYDGRYLALATVSGKLLVYSINECADLSGMFQIVLEKTTCYIGWMCWYRTEYVIVTGGINGHICLWSVPNRTCKILFGPKQWSARGVLTADDRKLYVSYLDRHLQLWDLTTDSVLMEIDEFHPMMHNGFIYALACDIDSNLYISADIYGMILFCTDNGPFKLVKISGRAPCLAFSPSNQLKLLAIGTNRGVINIWDVNQRKVCRAAALNEGITCIVWISERVIALATWKGNIYGIDALTFALKFKLSGHTNKISSMHYNPRSHMALTISFDTKAKIFQFPHVNE